MRSIGIDLAITGPHKAVVADERGQYLTSIIKFHPQAHEIDQLLARAREGAADHQVQVVMEPTGMAWFPVAVYLAQQEGVTVYLINSQQVADLRRFYKRHAKSDRIDARVLARLPLVNPECLHPLVVPAAPVQACQRQGTGPADRTSHGGPEPAAGHRPLRLAGSRRTGLSRPVHAGRPLVPPALVRPAGGVPGWGRDHLPAMAG